MACGCPIAKDKVPRWPQHTYLLKPPKPKDSRNYFPPSPSGLANLVFSATLQWAAQRTRRLRQVEPKGVWHNTFAWCLERAQCSARQTSVLVQIIKNSFFLPIKQETKAWPSCMRRLRCWEARRAREPAEVCQVLRGRAESCPRRGQGQRPCPHPRQLGRPLLPRGHPRAQ